MPSPHRQLETKRTRPTRLFRNLWLTLLLLPALGASAQSPKFIQQYRPLADSLSAAYGIPASVILGIAIVESGAGTSRNCKLLNNYFGIVGKNNLRKTRGIRTRYKQYANATESFTDFCRLQTRKKYYKTLKGQMDYRPWIAAIAKSGYSELPEIWKKRITETIRKNKLASG